MHTVFIHGAFPPPMHGAAAVTETIAKLTHDRGVKVIRLDVATPGRHDSRSPNLRRLVKSLWALKSILMSTPNPDDALYLAVAKGYGQFFDALAIVIARCKGMRLILHFHNYSVIARPTFSANLITFVLDPKALLVFLCDNMAERATVWRAKADAWTVVSNAALVSAPDGLASTGSKLSTLGYFSRVSEQKGVFRFIDLVSRLRGEGLSFEARIAGDFENESVEKRVRELSAANMIFVHGPVLGVHRERYLKSLDLLIFLSEYPHEAQPLVIFEALARGVTVITYEIGCTGELHDFPAVHVVTPESILNDPKALLLAETPEMETREVAMQTFETLRSRGTSSLEELVNFLARPKGVTHYWRGRN
jgi:glycosyltransferase involved in cell wall biosynthesis